MLGYDFKTTLISLGSEQWQGWGRGHATLTILLDFSVVFSTIDYGVLLQRVEIFFPKGAVPVIGGRRSQGLGRSVVECH